jgi:adenosylhomocysteine nucleosidase
VSPLLILTAVDIEARALARALELPRLSPFPFAVFGRAGIRIAAVGVGAALCDARWPALSEGLPSPLVVSAGVCGGLDPRLAAADLVIPERVLGPAGEVHEIGLPSRRVAATGGLLVTTREVVSTPAAKAALRAASGAVAVDMESAFIVARAAAFGCRAMVVRAVSDRAGERLPLELLDLVTETGGLHLPRALALMSRRPALVPGAIALGRRTRRALRAVAPALAALAA